jgi:hypothetical protein
MIEDLLTRIQREMHERLQALRGPVEEHERLAADLRALEAGRRPEAGVPRGRALGCESLRMRAVSPKVMRLFGVGGVPPGSASRSRGHGLSDER